MRLKSLFALITTCTVAFANTSQAQHIHAQQADATITSPKMTQGKKHLKKHDQHHKAHHDCMQPTPKKSKAKVKIEPQLETCQAPTL